MACQYDHAGKRNVAPAAEFVPSARPMRKEEIMAVQIVMDRTAS
jgi:hypothetical protein